MVCIILPQYKGRMNDPEQQGIIPRALYDMHDRISAEEEDPKVTFNVRLRFVEIYNEIVQVRIEFCPLG